METFGSPILRNVSIERDGVRYNCSWHVAEAGVHVNSAYGSKAGPPGKGRVLLAYRISQTVIGDVARGRPRLVTARIGN